MEDDASGPRGRRSPPRWIASVGRMRTRLYNRPGAGAIDSNAPMKARAWLAAAAFAAAAASPGGAARRPWSSPAGSTRPIHPAAADYLKRLLADAQRRARRSSSSTLSTPGGLLASTREMSSAILASKVPVATYVAPSGAQAASAGFFLLLSGDVAAMAPGTNTGAAHPVGGEGPGPAEDDEREGRAGRARVRPHARARSAAATSRRPRPRSRRAFPTRRRKRRRRG